MSALAFTWYGGDGKLLAQARRQQVIIPLVVGPPGAGDTAALQAQIDALVARIEVLEAGGGGVPAYMMDFRLPANAKYLGAML